MSALQSIVLSQEETRSLRQALKEFAPAILRRGRELHQRRAVKSAERLTQAGIQAKVQGGKLYQTSLLFAPKLTLTICTCPYATDCKHSAALILGLLAHAQQSQSPEPAKIANANPPSDTSASAPATPLPDSLVSFFQNKKGSNLSKESVAVLETIEPWWRQKTRSITTKDLIRAVGRRYIIANHRVQLWPEKEPPADQDEFLICVSLALSDCQLSLPTQLNGLIDGRQLKVIKQRRAKLAAIQEWQHQLLAWSHQTKTASPSMPELRLMLHRQGAVVQARHPGDTEFGKTTIKLLKDLIRQHYAYGQQDHHELNPGSVMVLQAALSDYQDISSTEIAAMARPLILCLSRLSAHPEMFRQHVVSANGEPLTVADEALRWDLLAPEDASGDYQLWLRTSAGKPPSSPIAILPGNPMRYVTEEAIYPISHWPFTGQGEKHWPVTIPAQALETQAGISALSTLNVPLPQRLQNRVRRVPADITVRCEVHRYQHSPSDYFRLSAKASFGTAERPVFWNGSQWLPDYQKSQKSKSPASTDDGMIWQVDKSGLPAAAAWLGQMPLRPSMNGQPEKLEQRIAGKDWPEIFCHWISQRPEGLAVELDAELASLREGQVSGQVRLELHEAKSGIDWFNLSMVLDTSDHTLTDDEIQLLLKAKGKWVRLEGKGWRKLEFQLTHEQEQMLADLGLSSTQLSSEKQKVHALQLAPLTKSGNDWLPAEQTQQLRRRLDKIQTKVEPELPASITATLRPYQKEGFDFLAYLSTNQFGGILADDMGLGKTLQALCWIAWLRAEQNIKAPVLVICPKSVQSNWHAEVERFFPSLKTALWDRSNAGQTGLNGEVDLLIVHYAQLRLHEKALKHILWGAVILDEAQAIKNPTSQISKAVCALEANNRLALTGTPIENRLLDLWSIFAFAMPGILGTRASFNRIFDSNEDPLARRRLAARTRPFLLRRTKKEVASELPDRIEEDLLIEMDGVQSSLYQAELKRARAHLLKVKTNSQLDKLRFNILTSLLRLRQICCHPRLVGIDQQNSAPAGLASSRKKAPKVKTTKADAPCTSAKMGALLEQLEPLMEEGQKVLVFSQFVEMLHIIREEITRQEWTTFILTGASEDRGALVDQFQQHEGAAIFLISLKAGGAGLNLTAASYVILYDPWWNPAVEAQAIDRTHRIGQKQTVFAYRLITKDSIEEKIRQLQKQKGALAQDILGEESLSQKLTLKDFQFLLEA